MIFKTSHNEMIIPAREINVYVFTIFVRVFVNISIIVYKIFEKKESR